MVMPYMDEGGVAIVTPPIKRKPDEEKETDGLETAMEELHSALMAKRYGEAADIFRSCFELMDSEPHEEGEHTNE